MKKLCLFSYNRIKNNRLIFIPLIVYVSLCVFSLVWFIAFKNILNIVFSIVFFLIAFVPFIIEYVCEIEETGYYYISYLLFNALSLIGPAFDVYTHIKNLDTYIHAFSGFIVAALGYGLGTKFINAPNKEKHNFYGCLLFGTFFCLTVGFIWEILEYFGTLFFKVDNQEDTLITSFVSYGLSGTRDFITKIENITQTVIYYTSSDGKVETVVINGGYFDLGFIDTIVDMIACLAGGIVFLNISLISFSNKKIFIKNYIPVSTTKEIEVIKNENENNNIS